MTWGQFPPLESVSTFQSECSNSLYLLVCGSLNRMWSKTCECRCGKGYNITHFTRNWRNVLRRRPDFLSWWNYQPDIRSSIVLAMSRTSLMPGITILTKYLKFGSWDLDLNRDPLRSWRTVSSAEGKVLLDSLCGNRVLLAETGLLEFDAADKIV